jgi:hypothetical protein
MAPDLGLLFVRIDYSDNLAWQAALSAATAVYDMDDFERMGALLRPVESPAFSNLTPEELIALARRQHQSRRDLLRILTRLGMVGARLNERQDAREDVAELAPAPRIDEPSSSLHRVPHRGSADRTKSSAVAASTSSAAHTSATISLRESAGRSASESRSTVKRYARPAASVLICRCADGDRGDG